MSAKYTDFDKTEEYNNVIAGKIQELIQLCNAEQIPVFISAAIKNDEHGTEYKNDMFASATNNVFLKDDKFPDFVNIMNGFKTIPPTKIVVIDCD